MRILAWVLLLGTAIVSIAAAIFLSTTNVGQSLILSSGQLGLTGNWALCLLAVSIGLSVFILRGLDGGGWSVSVRGIAAVVGTVVVLFVFGIYGLLAIGVVSMASTPSLVRKRKKTGQ